ncbi:MAG TPA: DNA gyrase subunit A [Dehalococcoidia bacterium]|jgi:DNA gyrase subunit A|nr:DNA gyrase subunit A [Dehalococcoidia bacterium]
MILGTVKPVNIEDEMRSSYLDYAMSVIVSRALPDVRDGLKPVHRRILYAMNDMGLTHTSPHRKSARIVGEVLGKYHPHGDASVYDAMVRMAQDFSMRYPLVDGQGNFGSVDNDPPAAMRYTEARLARIAEEMLVDIDKDTVDFMPNFDDSLTEPRVLPARIPNLLLNGSAGIAVGMATNIPPHNLVEVCDAITYLIDHPGATVEELTQFIKGPDFPTAGIILGQEGIKSAYATGHGKIVVRAKARIEDIARSGRHQIVVTELPYQTNKADLMEAIAGLVKEKKVSGISDLRDESDRHGMRIVIELRREAQPEQVLNNLYKYTAMQSSFFVNMLALVDGQPRVISLKETLQYYIDFRHEVITRRSKFELKEARARAHILEGLKIALDNIDRVIATIRRAETAEAARQKLMADFGLSQLQAQAILDMQLRRLANLERQKILDEYTEVLKRISYLEDLLASPRRMLLLIKEEMEDLKSKYGDPRRTEIIEHGEVQFREEDLIPHERMVVTLSHRGYVKRVPARLYTPQHRGGKGIIGVVTREEDAVRLLTVADTHDTLFFFTNRGKVYSLKCHEIPADSSRVARGTAVINLFPVAEDERVTTMVTVTDFAPGTYLLLATAQGEIKKTAVENFASVRSSGLIAMDLAPGDELVASCLAADQDDVLLVTQKGQSIRFPVASLRASSRTSGGVRAIRLVAGDRVVSMDKAELESFLLVVTSGGFGKLTPIKLYPRQHRAGAGVRTFKIAEKTGEVAAAKVVSLSEQVMIISAGGIVTRTPVREKDPRQGITIQGRSTQGVRLMKLEPGDEVVAVASFEAEKERGEDRKGAKNKAPA